MEPLQNYHALVEKVDQLVANVTQRYAAHISCTKGCDGCCRHFSISVVEGIALANALKKLPHEDVVLLRAQAALSAADGPCPLLKGGACALYAARPIICRTHGLPILINEEGQQRVDYCRLNFRQAGKISGDAVIAVDRLNTVLAAVNKLFVEQLEDPAIFDQGRVSIGEAILLDW